VLSINFISDLEKAIDQRSTQTGVMLHQITDLFLLNAGHYSADQIDLYDEVLKLLITKVDEAARAKLAQRIAATEQAPKDTVRSLALDESIEIAEPVLARSSALDDDFLVDCIAQRGQQHLLAIATRMSISERVSTNLINKGDRNVLTAVASNPGAKISEPSFEALVDKSVGNDWLSECIAVRSDIPAHHFRQLVLRASETVRKKLIGDDPRRLQLINDILPPSEPSPAKAAEKGKDYRTAELVVRSQPITEATVIAFAKAKKVEEVIVAIADLSGLSTLEIERIFTETWSSLVAVILKAIGFHLEAVQAIFGVAGEESDQGDLVRVKAEFIALRRATAERVVRFYQVRKTTDISGRNADHSN
jgi:uncharacterized protein (DUF2336 family)